MSKRTIIGGARPNRQSNKKEHCSTCPAHSGVIAKLENLYSWNEAQDDAVTEIKVEITEEVKDLKKCLENKIQEGQATTTREFESTRSNLSTLKYWIMGVLVTAITILASIILKIYVDAILSMRPAQCEMIETTLSTLKVL